MRRSLLISVFSMGCLSVTPQLARPTRMAAGGPPTHVGVADFNGDGKLDLWVTRGNVETTAPGSITDVSLVTSNRGSISVMLGRGDGTFAEAWNSAGLGYVQTADFNGDGKIDLALADVSGLVGVYLGKGDGTFVEPILIPVGGGGGLKSGDFNGDGKMDLVVLDRRPNPQFQGGRVAVLLGHGDGTFDAAQVRPVGRAPESMAVGDWNGDGKLDIAVADPRQLKILFMYGNGDGSFRPVVSLDTPFAPMGMAGVDMNKDGRLDLSVGTIDGTLIYLGNGDGTFRHMGDYYDGPTKSAFFADFDNDGHLDFVVSRRLFRGDGAGHFIPSAMPDSESNDSWVSVGDFNGDGFPDVVAADQSHSRLDVYLNRGAGHAPLRASR